MPHAGAASWSSAPVHGPAVRLGQEERAQAAPEGVEPLRLVPEPEEHLLGDVLRLGGAVEDPLGQTEDRPGVAPVDLGQRDLAPAGDGGHQLGVADLLDPLHPRCVRCRDARGMRDSAPSGPAPCPG